MKLSGQPWWFGPHPWPPIDPFNPAGAEATNLPAGDRFYKVFAPGAPPPPPPEPLGDVVLTFPTTNSILPHIVSISGNYRGISSTASNRNYSVDVLQDAAGKLSFSGAVDGLLGRTGSPQVVTVGYIRTIKGKPLIRLHGSLTGTLDGLPLRSSGTFTAPAALAAFDSTSFGLSATGSYSGKLGNTPFSGRKVPLQIPLLADSAANILDTWTLALTFHTNLIRKVQRTSVVAQLVLPSGDTVQFPERPVHYSKTGYTLSFAGGTNITANPPLRNRQASVGIRTMRLAQSTNGLAPISGTIRYHFLGQSGTANLLDFVPTSSMPATKSQSSR